MVLKKIMPKFNIAIALLMVIAAFPGALSAANETNASAKNDTIKGKDFKDVEVVYETVKRSAMQDRVTITQAMRKGSNNAGELLGRLEGMRFDNMSGSLSYMGSSNVKILVDSIERDESYIKKLRHNRFNQIDVIYQPSGEYMGYDVLINLRTNPNYEGYEGYVDGDGNLITGDRNGKGNALAKANAIGAFDYFSGKFSLSGQMTYNHSHTGSQYYSSTLYPLNGIEEIVLHSSRNDPGTIYNSHRGQAYFSADYKFNKRHSISAAVAFLVNKSVTDTDENLLVTNHNTNTSKIITSSTHSDNTNNTAYNAGLVYRGREGLWDFSAKANVYTSEFDRYYNLERTTGYYLSDNRHANFTYTNAKAHLRRVTANKRWSFMLYYGNTWQKYRTRRIENGVELENYTNVSNNLSLQVQWNMSRSTAFAATLALKQYSSNSSGIKENSAQPTGSFILYHAFSPKIWLRGQYSASYANPTATQSADFGEFTDSLSWRGGNPFLSGAMTHYGKIVVGLYKVLSLQSTITKSSNNINNIYYAAYGLRPDGIYGPYAASTPQNTDFINFDVRADFKMRIKQWDLNAAIMYAYQKYSFMEYSHHYSGIGGYAQCTYNLFKHNFRASILYNVYEQVQLNPQMQQLNPKDQTYINLTQTLFGGRLTIDFFYTFPFHFRSGDIHGELISPALEKRMWGNDQYWGDNSFQLSLTYRFWGGGKVRKFKDKEFESVEM